MESKIMDIDNLRNIWREHTYREVEKDKFSEEELKKVLRGKSKSMVSKIRRSLNFELVFSSIMTIVIAYFLRMEMPLIVEIAVMLLILIFLFLLGVYFAFVRNVNKYDLKSDNLKQDLEKLVKELDSLTKFIIKITVVLAPIGTLLGYIFGLYMGGPETFNAIFGSSENLIIMSITVVVAAVALYPITKLYVNFMYGRHIKNLKSYLNELTEFDNSIDNSNEE